MWVYVAIIILSILYVLIRRNAYWKNLNIPGPGPLPMIGNTGLNFIGSKHITEIFADIYLKYKQYPFVGIYRGETPCLLVRDPNIIKNVFIKHFKYFANNDVFIDKKIDPLIGRNPFVLKDDEWKRSRQEVAPAFSSGKIKAVFPLVEDVSIKLIRHVEKQIESASASGHGMDAKELCTKYTCDNVAVCAFGLEGKCFDEPDSEFRQLADKFVSPDSFQGFKFALSLFVPKLMSLLSIKLVPKHVEDRLIQLVSETIEYRRRNNVVRNDFLDFVSHLQSSKDNLIEITAHVTNFFIDGFETSSSVMSLVLFDLSVNQECQAKAREDISNVLNSENGEFSYESLQKMTYLDACINESLRKHPPLGSINRTCTESYKMETDSLEYERLSVNIEPGTPVIVPVLGLHMDPRYFPEPEKFIPERFFNKEIHKYVYFPFGDGPRACIGQRFGLMQIKIGLAQLLKNFEFTVNEKTQLPLKYMPYYLILFPKGGIWLNARKI